MFLNKMKDLLGAGFVHSLNEWNEGELTKIRLSVVVIVTFPLTFLKMTKLYK